MLKIYCGIYKITNNLNGKIYVGQSSNLYLRKKQHFIALKHNKHENKEMQKDWNQNHRGFRWDIVELCDVKQLNEREKFWIAQLNSMSPHGYNLTWVPYKRKEKRKRKWN